ncbi:Protein of unknown function [Bryocella elongata]|uniref:DUF3052 domain-containing protein n=1 Tax=Bryocella elongata TaxID=863522 RepID=A0A1H6BJB9_9BACT|nr:DUF3052 family protein [Bryocella elongata]SEG60276.1 Protein of unknown function [Bryocella elongata]
MSPSKAPKSPQPHRDYSGTPLERKLGLVTAKGGVGEVALLGEPDGFRELLGGVGAAEGVLLQTRLRPASALALCFVRSKRELAATMELLTAQLPMRAHVWIMHRKAHPKAHAKPDFSQNDVRDAGLAVGLVDYKVCSVNQDWSGLKFAWRKEPSKAGQ